MKKIISYMLAVVFVSIVLCSCSKSSNSSPNPYGASNGQTTFWSAHSSGVYPISISVNGQFVGTINGSYATQPACGDTTKNVVKFIAAPGSYTMTASAAGGAGTWTGTFTITQATCQTQLLN